MEYLLGTDYILSDMGARSPLPGMQAQSLHRDGGPFVPNPPYNVHSILPLSAQSLIALSEFTRKNGATRFVPASHLRDFEPQDVPPSARGATPLPARYRANLRQPPYPRRQRQHQRPDPLRHPGLLLPRQPLPLLRPHALDSARDRRWSHATNAPAMGIRKPVGLGAIATRFQNRRSTRRQTPLRLQPASGRSAHQRQPPRSRKVCCPQPV